jgi:hypothetical protein
MAHDSELEADCPGTHLHAHDATFATGSIRLRVVDTSAAFTGLKIVPEPGATPRLFPEHLRHNKDQYGSAQSATQQQIQ